MSLSNAPPATEDNASVTEDERKRRVRSVHFADAVTVHLLEPLALPGHEDPTGPNEDPTGPKEEPTGPKEEPTHVPDDNPPTSSVPWLREQLALLEQHIDLVEAELARRTASSIPSTSICINANLFCCHFTFHISN